MRCAGYIGISLALLIACGQSKRAEKPREKVDNTPAGRVLRDAMRADLEGRAADAERLYREALRMRPDHVQSAANLIMFLLGRKRIEDARVVAVRLVKATGGAARAHHLHAEVLMRNREFVAAEQALDEMLAKEPKHAAGLALRGRARAEQRKLVAAAADLRLAVRHDPDNPEYLAVLGSVLVRIGSYAEAEPHLRAALRHNPRHAAANLYYGVLLRDYRKLPHKALPRHLLAARLMDRWEARLQLGITQKSAGLHLNAERTLRATVEERPKSGVAWYHYADVLHFLGKWEAAEQSWMNAKSLGIVRPGMVFKLGVARFHNGKTDEAEKLINSVLAKNADHAFAYLYLGLIHRRRGLDQLAIDAFAKFVELGPKNHPMRKKALRLIEQLKAHPGAGKTP